MFAMKRIVIFLFTLNILIFSLAGENFNKKISDQEIHELEDGAVLIRNIEYYNNICLNKEGKDLSEFLLTSMKKLHPKYLVEVIKYLPYEGNEDLPEKLENILNNVEEYVGIPYWSVESKKWYDLFTYAKIIDQYEEEDKRVVKADLTMDPFDVVCERFEVRRTDDEIFYLAVNENKLSYHNKLDCIWPEKMQIGIYVFRDENNHWVMYGIGGVKAPKFPVFHKRISVSFENRIRTLCCYFLDRI